MDWVKYLSDNCQIGNASDINSIKKAVDLAALSLQFKYGWFDYSIACSKKTLHFMYTTPKGLFTAMIPISMLVKNMVVKPVLESIVKTHSEHIPSYRKN